MKKPLLILLVLFIFQNLHAQEKKKSIRPFFTGSFKLSLAINDNFTIDPNDDETFLNPSGAFFRIGVGYEFGEKFSLSLNGGYDYHFPYTINAFPTYLTVRYNIWRNGEDALFVQYGRGKMWRPSSRFSDGNYYNAGLGWQLEASSRWKPIILVTYHRKKIQGFEDSGNLESFSLGLGFRFF